MAYSWTQTATRPRSTLLPLLPALQIPPPAYISPAKELRAAPRGAREGDGAALTGHTGNNTVSIAILDHPGNPGYPTYWHARGYGLFAANPLGRIIFDPKQPPLNFTLKKGESATFRYRIIVYSRAASPSELNWEADSFATESKEGEHR